MFCMDVLSSSIVLFITINNLPLLAFHLFKYRIGVILLKVLCIISY